MNIKNLIEKTFEDAYQEPDEGPTKRLIHRNRSKIFVEILAGKLREHYKHQKGIYVLSKHHSGHHLEFGLNELLFDILVCKTGQIESSNRHKDLTYITKAIWQIESEFSRNSREATYDFNKLVLGASENKLFIGSQCNDEDAFLKPLEEPAKHCASNTYFALIPHPSEWKDKAINVHFYAYRDGWVKE